MASDAKALAVQQTLDELKRMVGKGRTDWMSFTITVGEVFEKLSMGQLATLQGQFAGATFALEAERAAPPLPSLNKVEARIQADARQVLSNKSPEELRAFLAEARYRVSRLENENQ